MQAIAQSAWIAKFSLREGINDAERMEKLGQHLAARYTARRGKDGESEFDSFETSLGIGCLYYSDLEQAQ
jgi:hypothetical protein